MKEAFAGVLGGLQGLGSDDYRERPVDRLTALGAIQRRDGQAARGAEAERTALLNALGVRLVAFKFGNCATSRADAEDMLEDILRWPTWGLSITTRQRPTIARQAIIEFAIDQCPTCFGAREEPMIEAEGTRPMMVCTGCAGSGKRRYSDAERVAAMGKAFAQEMETAHRIMGWAEALAVRNGMKMLEKW
jgi:hypothetical protein